MSDAQKPSIDERLEALVHTAELQHLDIAQLRETTEQLRETTAQLKETSERHAREQQRFRRAMRAALEAWISEDGAPGT